MFSQPKTAVPNTNHPHHPPVPTLAFPASSSTTSSDSNLFSGSFEDTSSSTSTYFYFPLPSHLTFLPTNKHTGQRQSYNRPRTRLHRPRATLQQARNQATQTKNHVTTGQRPSYTNQKPHYNRPGAKLHRPKATLQQARGQGTQARSQLYRPETTLHWPEAFPYACSKTATIFNRSQIKLFSNVF